MSASSAFIEIVDRFINALNAVPAVSSMIVRARSRAIPETCTNAINVYFDSASPEPGSIAGAPIDWTTKIAVECYAKTMTPGGAGDLAVDQLLKKTYERLAANATLSGKVAYIGDPEVEAEYDSTGSKTGWVRLMYSVTHQTANSLLELP